MGTYEEVKPTVKNAYRALHEAYEGLYDLVNLDLLVPYEASRIQRQIRGVMVQLDDFILENELG